MFYSQIILATKGPMGKLWLKAICSKRNPKILDGGKQIQIPTRIHVRHRRINHPTVVMHFISRKYLSRRDYHRLRLVNQLTSAQLRPMADPDNGFFSFATYRLTCPKATAQEFVNHILPTIMAMHNDPIRVWVPFVLLPTGKLGKITLPGIPMIIAGSPKKSQENNPQKSEEGLKQICRSIGTVVEAIHITQLVDKTTGLPGSQLHHHFFKTPLIKEEEKNIPRQPMVIKCIGTIGTGTSEYGMLINSNHPVFLVRCFILKAQKTAIKSTDDCSCVTARDCVVFGKFDIKNRQLCLSNCEVNHNILKDFDIPNTRVGGVRARYHSFVIEEFDAVLQEGGPYVHIDPCLLRVDTCNLKVESK
jgi:hypothetical protein